MCVCEYDGVYDVFIHYKTCFVVSEQGIIHASLKYKLCRKPSEHKKITTKSEQFTYKMKYVQLDTPPYFSM